MLKLRSPLKSEVLTHYPISEAIRVRKPILTACHSTCFFGYASCPRICTAALPLLGEVTEKLSKQGTKVRRVMITADTARDAVENMARPLTYFHPNFIGLTEGETALSTRYIAFSVDHTLAYEYPEYGPVSTHGALIHLMDAAGEALTPIPPEMDTHKATQRALTYLAPDS